MAAGRSAAAAGRGTGVGGADQGGCDPGSVRGRTYDSVCGVTIHASSASTSAAVTRGPGAPPSSLSSSGPSAPARTGTSRPEGSRPSTA
ncbi:hypothetical protein ACFW5I_10720 [Streptomyces sp. NPDC058818]|uniref:hypothetical protein n=1 Tax=Streptomyces sp. NPDC058818 TaxID=3346640 RepID=UPI003695861C